MTDDSNVLSLADLADIDVTDIEEIRYIDLPGGVYDWRIKSTDFNEKEFEGIRKFQADFELEVVECVAILEVLPNPMDRETLKGKIHHQKFTLDPTAPQEDNLKVIGRIRAFVTDAGGESKGKLGDIIQNAKDLTFRAQVVKTPSRTPGDDRKFANLKMEDRSKRAA